MEINNAVFEGYGYCDEVRTKMKKENTIQLVGGFVLACIAVGVIVTGAYLQWPGLYKLADCHCCDDIW